MFKRFSAWLAAFRPARFPYPRFLLALLAGAAGGICFSLLKLPLPWMLGPMLFSAVVAIAGAPVAAPNAVRAPMVVVMGVLLGAAVSPDLVSQAPHYLLSLGGLVLVMGLGTIASYVYFRVLGRFDRTTAYYSAVPGGITEMILLGEADGGNSRAIALVHSARILFVIFTVPFLVQTLSGVMIGGRPLPGSPLLSLPPADIALFAATCVAGAMLASVIRSPMAMFVGPLAVSAVIHGTGLSHFSAPSELVVAAQLVIGLTLGCRFAGARVREVWLPMLLALGASLLVLGIGLAMAYVIALSGGENLLALLLSYAPGGVAEMSFVAFALNIDAAFVVLHHLARLLLVVMLAQPFFGLIRRLDPKP